MSDQPPPYPEYNNPTYGGYPANPPYPPAAAGPVYPSNQPPYPTKAPYPPGDYQPPIVNPGATTVGGPIVVPGSTTVASVGGPVVVPGSTTVASVGGQVVVTQPAQTTVVLTNTAYRQPLYRSFPIEMDCPYCHEHMSTKVTYRSGALTWLAVGGLCLVGCICGCCLIPFCIDGCKNVVHSCSNCNRTIGVYNRMQTVI